MLSQVTEQSSAAEDVSHSTTASSQGAEVKVHDEKRCEEVRVGAADTEVAVVEEGYYSKLSVYLMMLFSGLAMGSDG